MAILAKDTALYRLASLRFLPGFATFVRKNASVMPLASLCYMSVSPALKTGV